MKLKAALLFLVFFDLAAGLALADMIEVKGRGFISGTILNEEGKELVFRDNDGQVQHFLRSEVTYIEREKSRLGKSLFSSATPAKHFEYRFDKSIDLADQIIEWLKQLSQSFLDFFFRGQDVKTLAKIVEAKVTGLKDYKSENLVVGGIGMAIMCFGALGLVVFGFRLIGDAFQQHFFWGIAFLAIPLSYTSSFVGGSLGLFAMLPLVASLCFIVFHWRAARVTFVAQIFSVSLVLLGFFVLQMAS